MSNSLPNVIFCNIHNDKSQIEYIQGLLPELKELGYKSFLSELYATRTENFGSWFDQVQSTFGVLMRYFFNISEHNYLCPMVFLLELSKINTILGETEALESQARKSGYSVESLSFNREASQMIDEACNQGSIFAQALKIDNGFYNERSELMFSKIKDLSQASEYGVVTLVGAFHCPYIKDKIAADDSLELTDFKFVFPYDSSIISTYFDGMKQVVEKAFNIKPSLFSLYKYHYNNSNGQFPTSYFFMDGNSAPQYIDELRSSKELVKVNIDNNQSQIIECLLNDVAERELCTRFIMGDYCVDSSISFD